MDTQHLDVLLCLPPLLSVLLPSLLFLFFSSLLLLVLLLLRDSFEDTPRVAGGMPNSRVAPKREIAKRRVVRGPSAVLAPGRRRLSTVAVGML